MKYKCGKERKAKHCRKDEQRAKMSKNRMQK